MITLNFINGKAIVKDGRRTVAKVFDRKEFFKGLNISYNKNYPFSLEMAVGARECKTKEECIEFIEKYSNLNR